MVTTLEGQDFFSLLAQLDALRSALAGQHMLELQRERQISRSVTPVQASSPRQVSKDSFSPSRRWSSQNMVLPPAATAAMKPMMTKAKSHDLLFMHAAGSIAREEAAREQVQVLNSADVSNHFENQIEIISDLDKESDDDREENSNSCLPATAKMVSFDAQSRLVDSVPSRSNCDVVDRLSSMEDSGKAYEEPFRVLEQWRFMRRKSTGRADVADFLKCAEAPISEASRKDHSPFVINPYSKANLLRQCLCWALLMVDIFEIPFNASFLTSWDSSTREAVEVALMTFWFADMCLTFLTGVFRHGQLHMDFATIASTYFRTWFALDAVLLILRVWLIIDVAIGSLSRYARSWLWMFQLLRSLHFKDWWCIVNDFLLGFHGGVMLQGIVKLLVIVAVVIHLLACAWHALGDNSTGWVDHHFLQGGHVPVRTRYVYSLNWAASQLHGSAEIGPSTTREAAFATAALFLGYAGFAMGVGQVTQLMLCVRDLHKELQQGQCRYFLLSKRVSGELLARVDHSFRQLANRSAMQNPGQAWRLLDELPRSLLSELSKEVKVPVLVLHNFFESLCHSVSGSRAVQHLCAEAASTLVFHPGEAVFTAASPCSHMFVIESGRLNYTKVSLFNRSAAAAAQSAVRSRLARASAFEVMECHCSTGMALSEPVLWTRWHFLGDLKAYRTSTLLAIDTVAFAAVMGQTGGLVAEHTAHYAKAFVRGLNELAHSSLSDLTTVHLDAAELMSTSRPALPFQDEHFIFLSHFKQEAGTEAALLLESLDKVIQQDDKSPAADFESPVFLDSETLNDLSSLNKHVIQSHNIVVLLTSKVFTRPWCIVELVLAIRAGTHIVPCEIQRPGLHYTYPDEGFFNMLAAGQILTPEDMQVLRNEGVTLKDAEDAIRHIAKLIAVTFSPHKSLKIRTAEAQALLERCGLRGATESVNGSRDTGLGMREALSSRRDTATADNRSIVDSDVMGNDSCKALSTAPDALSSI